MRRRVRSARWILSPFTCFLFTILLAALACNAPGRLVHRSSGFTAEDLRRTVEAMPAPATPTPAPPQGAHAPAPQGVAGVPTPQPEPQGGIYTYRTRAGDTLEALSGRFGVRSDEIPGAEQLSAGFLPAEQVLSIPARLEGLSPAQLLLPDSELVYSPAAAGFDLDGYISTGNGYLGSFREKVDDQLEQSGAEIIARVSRELSVNPRLLLGILDLRSGWVFDRPPGASAERYPLGFRIAGREGLYEEIRIAATQLNLAYYGWRAGSFKTIHFKDGITLRLDPTLNAGTVALMHLFSLLYTQQEWIDQLYGPSGFVQHYASLFGEPWARAVDLVPADLEPPVLELPFTSGEAWSLTAGPHNAWNAGTPLGALDFSPITGEPPCTVSSRWVTASAPGTIARAADNAVTLDLDGDGDEATGWVVVYYHLAEENMIEAGSAVQTGQRLGHPSCEGGQATGTHVHMSRKYNGEWLAADGPVPFVLSGWRAVAGERIYQGKLVRSGQVVTADPAGRSGSTIIR